MGAYRSAMGIRPLFALLLTLSVLFASALTGAQASAATPMHHDMQMMDQGHCGSMPGKADGKAPVKSCCIAMCMAVGIAPAGPLPLRDIPHHASYFAKARTWHGFLGEIAPPPPRLA